VLHRLTNEELSALRGRLEATARQSRSIAIEAARSALASCEAEDLDNFLEEEDFVDGFKSEWQSAVDAANELFEVVQEIDKREGK
jgi:hypothetical protein